MTATEASRSFASLLDEAERGDTTVVTRGGRRIATIGPAVLETLPVESYDLTTANEHGRLLAHVHREGTKRGAHDLIIAATAAATGRVVLTGDRSARFCDLPGVECIHVE